VLHCLWRQNDTNYEVLVSNDDDQSKYKETEAVCKEFEKKGMHIVHFYTGQYKRGRGWSVETYPYNVGIRHAKGDIILLNSGDVMSVTNTIDQHRQRHLSGDKVYVSTVHAITFDVYNKIDTYEWKNSPSCLLFKGSCYKMFTGIGVSYTQAYDQEDAAVPYHFLMSVNKTHLHSIRGFDEDYYGIMPCGDDDLADRLRRSGLPFEYCSEILAIHQYHKCLDLIGEGKKSEINPKVGSGHVLYQQRSKDGVVRNANHEWGQYPRDMNNLPPMSGVMN
jgi:GT2 family glycosyltransferase